jgi:hypothetical protein
MVIRLFPRCLVRGLSNLKLAACSMQWLCVQRARVYHRMHF